MCGRVLLQARSSCQSHGNTCQHGTNACMHACADKGPPFLDSQTADPGSRSGSRSRSRSRSLVTDHLVLQRQVGGLPPGHAQALAARHDRRALVNLQHVVVVACSVQHFGRRGVHCPGVVYDVLVVVDPRGEASQLQEEVTSGRGALAAQGVLAAQQGHGVLPAAHQVARHQGGEGRVLPGQHYLGHALLRPRNQVLSGLLQQRLVDGGACCQLS
mmetsp:Transcript_17465/g.37750  ORF Transcript_17465/g.37750 Transcript_17465/m.37750 type:complete len:215 (-) Transcript_17465:1615-2259(-)